MKGNAIMEQMRKEDRLLKESAVTKAVQKALIDMGYEPFEDKVRGVYTAIENVSTVCTIEEFEALKDRNESKKVAYQGEHKKCPTCGSFHIFGRYCSECGQKVEN